MKKLVVELSKIDVSNKREESRIVADIKKCIKGCGYTTTEINDDKPWGAYFRFGQKDTTRFLQEFFPGSIVMDNIANSKNIGLSIKILLVDPGQGLSWQYHNKRSEVWAFITNGGYKRSMNDKEGLLQNATRGDVVQFAAAERHRLVGVDDGYTLVAEIWQHSDLKDLSNEEDIVRLIDDYSRVSKKAQLKAMLDKTPKTKRVLKRVYLSLKKHLPLD